MKITQFARLVDRKKDTSNYLINSNGGMLELTAQIDGSHYTRWFGGEWVDLGVMTEADICDWLSSYLDEN